MPLGIYSHVLHDGGWCRQCYAHNQSSLRVNMIAHKFMSGQVRVVKRKSSGCSGQFMRGNRKLMALASCAYIGIYVFCADARPRTAVHLTRGFAACDAASTPWHEGRVRIPPMFRCLYICRDLRPASPRRRDRWSPSDARDTNRASPDTIMYCVKGVNQKSFVGSESGSCADASPHFDLQVFRFVDC